MIFPLELVQVGCQGPIKNVPFLEPISFFDAQASIVSVGGSLLAMPDIILLLLPRSLTHTTILAVGLGTVLILNALLKI